MFQSSKNQTLKNLIVSLGVAGTAATALAEPSHMVMTTDADKLYRVNVEVGELYEVGRFSGDADIVDLAYLRDRLYGISNDTLYVIDADTAQATEIDSLDESVSALAGKGDYLFTVSGNVLYRINPDSAALIEVGQLSDDIQSCGDLVFGPDGSLYASVVTSDAPRVSSLAIVDIEDGEAEIIGSTNYSEVSGLTFHGDDLIGTSAYGYILEINPNSAATTFLHYDGSWFQGLTTTPIIDAPVSGHLITTETGLFHHDFNLEHTTELLDLRGSIEDLEDAAVVGETILLIGDGALYEADLEGGEIEMISQTDDPLTALVATEDKLYAMSEEDFFEIDTETFAVTEVGELGDDFEGEGDLLVDTDGRILATVMNRSGSGSWLVEINPNTGTAEAIGATGIDDIEGLTFHRNGVIGLTEAGRIASINTNNANAVPEGYMDLAGITGIGSVIPTSTDDSSNDDDNSNDNDNPNDNNPGDNNPPGNDSTDNLPTSNQTSQGSSSGGPIGGVMIALLTLIFGSRLRNKN